MSEKRKDNKERVLKTGESQRKDLIYQYCYTDIHGKRQTIYSSDCMDIKTLQYVMGHSDVGVTLNVYTHASYDRAAEQMAKILDFKETDMRGKQRKSG